MFRKPVIDSNLTFAKFVALRAQASAEECREHIDQSLDACRRSQTLLRATMPVLPYRQRKLDGERG
jgi:hypothetical protein